MGTRCGNIDPSIVFYLHNTMNMSVSDIDRMLHRESGLLGVSEISHDMRQIGSYSIISARFIRIHINDACRTRSCQWR